MNSPVLPDPITMGTLANFARYVTEHACEAFTGPLLAQYKERRQWDDAELAAALGCSEDDLVHLAICGRPRRVVFEADIERIAAHVHAWVEPLRALYQEMLTSQHDEQKMYVGWFEDADWHVTVNGRPLRSVGYHAPDGFSWGYDGSACAELALSLLRSYFEEYYVTRQYLLAPGKVWAQAPQCWELHLAFVQEVLAHWGRHDSWQLTATEIGAWVERKRMQKEN